MSEQPVTDAFTPAISDLDASRLGKKTQALLRIAALVAAESAPASYQWAVNVALANGAVDDEIVGVLLSISAVVGEARVTSAAPALASALGYELDP